MTKGTELGHRQPMNHLRAAVLMVLASCAAPGYDPIVSGRVLVPPGVTITADTVLTVTMWEPAEPMPVQLGQLQHSAADGLDFTFELSSGYVLITAHLDLTGDGLSADDLVADGVEASQGDLDVRLHLGPQD